MAETRSANGPSRRAPRKPAAPLTETHALPGHLLRRCHQISVALFLKECRAFNLTPLQYVALCALEECGPMDQASLGGVCALDRTTAALVIAKLEKRRLIRCRRSSEDRRKRVAEILPAGCALRAEAAAAVHAAQSLMMQPLSRPERAALVRLLDKMARANNSHSRAPSRGAV